MTEMFTEICPTYIVYGMTYEQFWYGDPWMVRAYKEAFMLRQKKRNEEMWIQGAYVSNAVAVAIGNAFSKHKVDYLKKPLDIYPKTEAERKDEIRQERMDLVRKLSMLSSAFKRKQQKKGTDQNGKS